MERTGTGIGSLHFVYCLTEQVKINLPYVFYTVDRIRQKAWESFCQ